DAMLVLYYHDASGARVAHSMIGMRRNISLDVPQETAKIRWGLRISGPGTSTLHTLYLAAYKPPPLPLISRGRTLVISNIYPSYANLYRNAFVHTRLHSYLRSGFRTEVILPGDN